MKNWSECSAEEKIERWENAIRVLKALPPHEKRKHFDMSCWGEKTECGTVACAAGHCGLDPWFRRRGVSLNFTRYKVSGGDGWWDSEMTGACGFFGEQGYSAIFCNTETRPVSRVVKEMQLLIKLLKDDPEEKFLLSDEIHKYLGDYAS